MENEYRELEVYIGPFEEFRGRILNKPQSIKLVSNGNNNTLKISAEIHKAILDFCTCVLHVWNLAPGTRASLKKEQDVFVFAGLEGREKELVYFGGIRYVNSERQGPDIITTIDCSTGLASYMRSTFSKTYTQGVSLKSAVKEIAEKMPGVSIDETNIKIEGEIGYNGFSCAGSVFNTLNDLSREYGFSWTIDDGIFKAQTDGEYNQTQMVLSASNGLRKVSPRLFGPWAYQRGADIEAQYQPNINLKDKIKVVSVLNEQQTGVYGINEIDYNLCPKDNSWEMHIVSLTPFRKGESENG